MISLKLLSTQKFRNLLICGELEICMGTVDVGKSRGHKEPWEGEAWGSWFRMTPGQ